MSINNLSDQIKTLARRISKYREDLEIRERNEEWTKAALIFPLLETLGWDRAIDISYENSPMDVDGRIDVVLKCQTPIGIESKAVDVPAPRDSGHPQIRKGIRQATERGARFFVWTNGDAWQFFALSLPRAPMCQIALSEVAEHPGREHLAASRFAMIQKETIVSDPDAFVRAIRENWKLVALPIAWQTLLDSHASELAKLLRKALPDDLHVQDCEILQHLRSLRQPQNELMLHPKTARQSTRKQHTFPLDWQELPSSFEPEYEMERKRFQTPLYRKLGEFIIGAEYKPWSRRATWRYVGVPDQPNERKKLGPVISLFREWRFIDERPGTGMYQRVDESLPCLRKLFG